MSIGFVLRATDGLVVVADGLTSHAVTNAPVDSDVAKIAKAPHDLSFVVVALGRASVGGVPTHEVVGDVLAEIPADELKGMGLREVMEVVLTGLGQKMAALPQQLLTQEGETLTVGLHVLVAGYAVGGRDAEVWTGTVPEVAPGVTQSIEGVTMSGSGGEADTLVFDLFDSYFASLDLPEPPSSFYLLDGLSMAEVWARAEAQLRLAAAERAEVFRDAGVGGTWLAAHVRPGAPVTLCAADIGPPA